MQEVRCQEQEAGNKHQTRAHLKQVTDDTGQGRGADKIIGRDQRDNPAREKQEQPQHSRGRAPHTN